MPSDDVAGDALGVDVTDPDEQVGVLAVGAHEDAGADRSDQVRSAGSGPLV